jgi:hypothetical protein
MSSVSERCQSAVAALQSLSTVDEREAQGIQNAIIDQLTRLRLFCGNIGAFQPQKSRLSVESRLQDAEDVLQLMLRLMDTLQRVISSLKGSLSKAPSYEAVSMTAADVEHGTDSNEHTLLIWALRDCITRLFRISRLIQKAASTDKFARALSRFQSKADERFDERYDLTHVGQKFPRLSQEENKWLKNRLGRAITQRRQLLSYSKNHRNDLGTVPDHREARANPQSNVAPSEPSSLQTKATSLDVTGLTLPVLATAIETVTDDDSASYTTVTRSLDLDNESTLLRRIPRLKDLRTEEFPDFECPFCYRLVNFKREKVWRKHVFADLRSYVCTFPRCDAPYFCDINEWFSHEMEFHRMPYNCMVCQNGPFLSASSYLEHIESRHPVILQGGNRETILIMSRQPLSEIPVSDCPCCTDWEPRLRQSESYMSAQAPASKDQLAVTTSRFKRHLGSHLEQLALFAIPTEESDQNRSENDDSTSGDDASVGSADLQEEPDDDRGGEGPPLFVFQIDELREHPNVVPNLDVNGYWTPSLIPGYISVVDEGVTGLWWGCDGQRLFRISKEGLPPNKMHYKSYSMFFSGGKGFQVLCGSKLSPRF